ncbi:hypothetical protein [Actinoallomurus acaciae]|uniref:Uncharacterized protein n=1 Tax=Actinoallomurus acaciae TaxID=502577 RepID=A0ABV5YWU8_9ACTN
MTVHPGRACGTEIDAVRTSTPGAGEVEVHVAVADLHGNTILPGRAVAEAGPVIAAVDAAIRAMPAAIHLRRTIEDLQLDKNGCSGHRRSSAVVEVGGDQATGR